MSASSEGFSSMELASSQSGTLQLSDVGAYPATVEKVHTSTGGVGHRLEYRGHNFNFQFAASEAQAAVMVQDVGSVVQEAGLFEHGGEQFEGQLFSSHGDDNVIICMPSDGPACGASADCLADKGTFVRTGFCAAETSPLVNFVERGSPVMKVLPTLSDTSEPKLSEAPSKSESQQQHQHLQQQQQQHRRQQQQQPRPENAPSIGSDSTAQGASVNTHSPVVSEMTTLSTEDFLRENASPEAQESVRDELKLLKAPPVVASLTTSPQLDATLKQRLQKDAGSRQDKMLTSALLTLFFDERTSFYQQELVEMLKPLVRMLELLEMSRIDADTMRRMLGSIVSLMTSLQELIIADRRKSVMTHYGIDENISNGVQLATNEGELFGEEFLRRHGFVHRKETAAKAVKKDARLKTASLVSLDDGTPPPNKRRRKEKRPRKDTAESDDGGGIAQIIILDELTDCEQDTGQQAQWQQQQQQQSVQQMSQQRADQREDEDTNCSRLSGQNVDGVPEQSSTSGGGGGGCLQARQASVVVIGREQRRTRRTQPRPMSAAEATTQRQASSATKIVRRVGKNKPRQRIATLRTTSPRTTVIGGGNLDAAKMRRGTTSSSSSSVSNPPVSPAHSVQSAETVLTAKVTKIADPSVTTTITTTTTGTTTATTATTTTTAVSETVITAPIVTPPTKMTVAPTLTEATQTITVVRPTAITNVAEREVGEKCAPFQEEENRPNRNKAAKTTEICLATCSFCELSFGKRLQLAQHLKQTHSSQLPQCDVCGRRFAFETTLRQHRDEKHPDPADASSRKECEHCGRTFADNDRLQAHLFVHTGTKQFECSICSRRCLTKAHLDQHLAAHDRGEERFYCERCDKPFAKKTNYKHHLRLHTGEKNFECDICHKRFATRQYLHIHQRSHSADKPFTCDVCGRGFQFQHVLVDHVRTHTGETPFVCEVCGMSFKVKRTLKRHMKTHGDERPHACHICQRGFKVKATLREHMKTHSHEKPYQCHECGLAYKRNVELRKHACPARQQPQQQQQQQQETLQQQQQQSKARLELTQQQQSSTASRLPVATSIHLSAPGQSSTLNGGSLGPPTSLGPTSSVVATLNGVAGTSASNGLLVAGSCDGEPVQVHLEQVEPTSPGEVAGQPTLQSLKTVIPVRAVQSAPDGTATTTIILQQMGAVGAATAGGANFAGIHFINL